MLHKHIKSFSCINKNTCLLVLENNYCMEKSLNNLWSHCFNKHHSNTMEFRNQISKHDTIATKIQFGNRKYHNITKLSKKHRKLKITIKASEYHGKITKNTPLYTWKEKMKPVSSRQIVYNSMKI